MGYRRPAAVDLNVDLDAIPPNWCARWVWVMRWGKQHMGGAENVVQNYRTVYNAVALEPVLERVQQWWADKTPDQQRRVWRDDDGDVWHDRGASTTPCPTHGRAPFCPKDCPTVTRLQRDYDDTNHWRKDT